MTATETKTVGIIIIGSIAALLLHGLTKKEPCCGECSGECGHDESDGLGRLAAPCQSNRCWVGMYKRTANGGYACMFRRTGLPGCETVGTPN